jgi:hypothetical protein
VFYNIHPKDRILSTILSLLGLYFMQWLNIAQYIFCHFLDKILFEVHYFHTFWTKFYPKIKYFPSLFQFDWMEIHKKHLSTNCPSTYVHAFVLKNIVNIWVFISAAYNLFFVSNQPFSFAILLLMRDRAVSCPEQLICVRDLQLQAINLNINQHQHNFLLLNLIRVAR